MNFKTFEFSPFHENTYIVYDETKECVIIDPGNFNEKENNILDNFLKENHLKLVGILNTHNHLDHIFGANYLVNKYNVSMACHEKELEWIGMFEATCKRYGLKINSTPPTPKNILSDGDVFKFGNTKLDIIHMPGHSAGSLVFHNIKDKIIISGDVIFKNSIGRTDLPGGNYNELIINIKNKLFSLSEDTLILPGHDVRTTIGEEKNNNPFFNN